MNPLEKRRGPAVAGQTVSDSLTASHRQEADRFFDDTAGGDKSVRAGACEIDGFEVAS